MRRAQVDAVSQPVRNLVTDPGVTVSNSTITVRTNVVLNPRMTNTNLGGYGTGTQTLTALSSGVPTHPEGITTAVRTGYSGGVSNPGVLVMLLPDVSTVYTISGWVYNEGTATENIAIALRGHSSGGAINVAPGSWVRLSWTMTTPAALGAGNDFGFRIATPTTTGSFLTTGVLIEKAPSLGTYFDGAKAIAGDFSHAWSGSANASQSVQNANRASSFPAGASVGVRSVEWAVSGTTSLRIIPLTSSSNTWASMTLPTTVGKTYTFQAKTRLVAPLGGTLESRTRRLMARSGGDFQSPAIANAAGVYTQQVTFVAGDVTAQLFFWNGASQGNGDVWYDDIMLVEGTYQGDYINPDRNTFSKWDGAADVSTSVGYPPQLLDIAGKPESDVINTAGTVVTLPGGFTNTEARTIYTAYQSVLDIPDASIYAHVAYGSNALSDTVPDSYITLRQQSYSGGGNNILARMTGGGGAITYSSVGVNVACYGVNLTGNLFIQNNNAAAVIERVVNLPHEKIQILAPNAGGNHIRTLIYRGYHDAATRQAVSRYLGNKYGANVA